MWEEGSAIRAGLKKTKPPFFLFVWGQSGIGINENLKWTQHVNMITAKANSV